MLYFLRCLISISTPAPLFSASDRLMSFFFSVTRPPPIPTLFPYTTLFRSRLDLRLGPQPPDTLDDDDRADHQQRSEEHTSELQSRGHLVCRLLLEKKKR